MKTKVVDFLKKQGEVLSQPKFDLTGHIPPVVKEHWSEIRTLANNTALASWAREHQLITPQRQDESCDPIVLPVKAQSLLVELSKQINTVIHTGPWQPLEQNQIQQFADVTNDQQWIHTDPVRAAGESPFKTTIAHGFLTLSLLPALTESVDPQKPRYPTAKMAVNYGLNQVRFPYPVKQGSVLRAHTTLLSVTPIRQGLELVEEVRVEIQGTRRPACIAQMVLRLYF